MTHQSRMIGYLLAATGAALFSTKAIFIKLAFQDRVDAALLLAYRMIFSLPIFIAIGVWALMKRRAKGEPEPTVQSYALATLTGFFGYYLASAFDFAGLQYISASLERLVLFTYPLFVMFLAAIILRERITGYGWAAAVVTYIGLAIVFLTDLPAGGRDTIIGTVLVLGASLTFAIHQILAKRYLKRLGSALFTSVSLTSAGVFCILHQLFVGAGDFSTSPRFLWLAFGCAIVATVLPTFMINAGLHRTSPQAVSMIATLSPVVTIALSILILGEPFTWADAIGSLLVLAGVGLFTWGDIRNLRLAS